jgi:hypothetical protein
VTICSWTAYTSIVEEERYAPDYKQISQSVAAAMARVNLPNLGLWIAKPFLDVLFPLAL